MSITVILGISLISLLVYKVYDCVTRNNLNKLDRIKFTISLLLILTYIATGYFLNYPDSLYWFIFLAILIVSFSLSSKLVREEFSRYLTLSKRDKIINISYYSLVLFSISIIF
ncbi:MAG: prepilin signal peptidase PulO-like enzyme (type II secretory pathway) [Psychroserpens sp.]|jgi:prepilin signal peptidase PulO-like enzyme (type II secretory pathway)